MGSLVGEMVHAPISFHRFCPTCFVLLLVVTFFSYTIFNLMNSPSIADFHTKDDRTGCNSSPKHVFFVDSTTYKSFNFDYTWLDVDKLVYNRAPKCGSTTLYNMMRKLSVELGYRHINSKVYDKKMVNESEQRRFVKKVKRAPSPCSFDRHVFFIDFLKFGEKSPLFINVIRDPVERIISSYFYRRVAAKRRTNREKPSQYWMNKNFEQCVLTSDPECTYIDGQIYSVLLLPYFCGQDQKCLIHNHPWALEQAKQNIEKFYPVVGVLEEMNVTLLVLEEMLPRFFNGALKLYHNLGIRRNQNTRKEHVSEEVKAILRANLTTEYDLYHFVQHRLHQQLQDILIKKEVPLLEHRKFTTRW